MSVKHIADHYQRSLDLTPRHWAKTLYMRTIIRVVSSAYQILENERFDALIGSHLDFAVGPTLALWGWTFGAGPQGGLSPEWYRRLIRLSIATMFSTGNTESALQRWSLATEPSRVEFYRYPAEAFVLVCFRDEWMPPAYAARAAAILRKGGPAATIMLWEALDVYHGSDSRTRNPVPANPPTSAPGAKVW